MSAQNNTTPSLQQALQALNPLDGRYARKLKALSCYFSEAALIKHRVQIEIEWFIHLAEQVQITELPDFSTEHKQQLRALYQDFHIDQAQQVKAIEATTNHDVKAVEYYIKQHIKQHISALNPHSEFIHFACTSEDINNLSYALMLQQARTEVVLPGMTKLLAALETLAKDHSGLAMLARTHGQPASPTTLGKEIHNLAYRLHKQVEQIKAVPIPGKMNGAVGNYNAHRISYPEVNWLQVSQTFIAKLKLNYNPLTTQIEPHDYIAELFQTIMRFNTILIDLNRDIWGYISLGYFKQKIIAGEVGSSTMPHKINPIDFENAEGNLGLSNAILGHLSEKLPISRWQRDLTDSTLLRNLGVGLGYACLAYQNNLQGINKLEANPEAITADLNQNHQVLAEAIQTVMRRYGIAEPYEKLKAFTRGKPIDQASLTEFIEQLPLADPIKAQLKQLKPQDYIGYAKELAHYGFEKVTSM